MELNLAERRERIERRERQRGGQGEAERGTEREREELYSIFLRHLLYK